MIIQWIVQALGAVFTGLLTLFPSVAVPSFMTSAQGMFADLISGSASMGAWVPWSLMIGVSGVVVTCIVAGFGIKVIRIVASFLTGGGGSSA